MKRPIATVILLVVAIAIWGYDPPSDAELGGWWESLGRDERIAELRKLDEIEHAEATVVDPPRLAVVQTADGMINAYFTGPLLLDVAGHLSYEIPLPSVTTQGNREHTVWLWFGAGVGIGLIVSAALALIL